MAKMQIFRKSNRIVNDEDAVAYKAEWQPLYDKVQERIKEIHADTSHRLFKYPSHHLNYRFLGFLERQLFKKYSTVDEVEMPKSPKGWNALIESYEGCPIMLAQRTDGKGVVMVILDTMAD